MSKESRKKVRISELNFKNIGDRITFIRMMHGKTLDEFSSMLGISKGNLSDLENNKNKPSYEVIACIAEKFSVNSEWILTGGGRLFKRVYTSEEDVENFENLKSIIKERFENSELALKIIEDAAKIEKVSSRALIEVADYINIKLKNLFSSGERRFSQRRTADTPEDPPETEERRSGNDRRAHELYRG